MIIIISMICVLVLTGNARAGEITISAAVSLKEVINDLAAGFARENPGVRFVKNFGASGPLAKQIENVAPTDIFIPSNLRWMEYLKGRNLLDNSSIGTFTFNSLVFAGAKGKKVSCMGDLPKLKKIAIGRPERVAAGEYALEALIKSGIYKKLDKQPILASDSRDCLRYVERGEADGALVYRTDALQSRQLRIFFTVPRKFHSQVVYPMCLTATGAKNDDARAFFKYLHGSFARDVLHKYGFVTKRSF